MNLGTDLAEALPALQAQAKSRMTDTVTVGLATDGTDEDGNATTTITTTRYTGPGRVRWASRDVANAESPGMPTAVQEPYLSIPFGSPRIYVGDTAIVTASTDPLLAGRTLRVTGNAAAGLVSAYRYPLEELD